MSITKRPTARTALLTAVTAGAGLAGLLGVGGVAQASTASAVHAHAASPNGYVVTDSCSGVAGSISYSPGLLATRARSVHATMTGTTSGCQDIFTGPESGDGTFTAILSGKASAAAENFSGTFTINWPASSGYNPSNGTMTVTESNGVENVSGQVTSGFDTGSVMALQYVTTGNTGKGTKKHPITAQTYTNTQQLSLSRNEG